MRKSVKELVAGDRLKLADGEFVTVTKIERGFAKYESGAGLMVYHSKGWSQAPKDMVVTVK